MALTNLGSMEVHPLTSWAQSRIDRSKRQTDSFVAQQKPCDVPLTQATRQPTRSEPATNLTEAVSEQEASLGC